MGGWYERLRLECPKCGYDVAQTLEDGFTFCPECGGAVSEGTCARDVERIPRAARRLIYLSWFLPCPASVFVLLDPRFAWIVIVTAIGVYVSWLWIENWVKPGKAWQRAIVPALVILVIDAAALAGLAAIITVVLLSARLPHR